jgi:hypothetical protein
MKISSRDPETTISGQFNIHFSLDETHASNPIHFFISFFVIMLIIFKKNFKKNEKYYSISIIAGYILFCTLIKWNLSHSRFFLLLFILSGPLVSLFLYKFKFRKITFIITILFFIYSLPYILSNNTRSLVFKLKWENNIFIFDKPDFLTKTRDELYYTSSKDESVYLLHSAVSKKIRNANCKKIGFDSPNYNGLLYPLWHIIKKDSQSSYIKVLHLNVQNKSKVYYKNYSEDHKICAIINYDDNEKETALNLF